MCFIATVCTFHSATTLVPIGRAGIGAAVVVRASGAKDRITAAVSFAPASNHRRDVAVAHLAGEHAHLLLLVRSQGLEQWHRCRTEGLQRALRNVGFLAAI